MILFIETNSLYIYIPHTAIHFRYSQELSFKFSTFFSIHSVCYHTIPLTSSLRLKMRLSCYHFSSFFIHHFIPSRIVPSASAKFTSSQLPLCSSTARSNHSSFHSQFVSIPVTYLKFPCLTVTTQPHQHIILIFSNVSNTLTISFPDLFFRSVHASILPHNCFIRFLSSPVVGVKQ